MAKYLRTEKKKNGKTTYIYKCDECGEEIARLVRRDDQRKLCFECGKIESKLKSIERTKRHEEEVRCQAIDDFMKHLLDGCTETDWKGKTYKIQIKEKK